MLDALLHAVGNYSIQDSPAIHMHMAPVLQEDKLSGQELQAFLASLAPMISVADAATPSGAPVQARPCSLMIREAHNDRACRRL